MDVRFPAGSAAGDVLIRTDHVQLSRGSGITDQKTTTVRQRVSTPMRPSKPIYSSVTLRLCHLLQGGQLEMPVACFGAQCVLLYRVPAPVPALARRGCSAGTRGFLFCKLFPCHSLRCQGLAPFHYAVPGWYTWEWFFAQFFATTDRLRFRSVPAIPARDTATGISSCTPPDNEAKCCLIKGKKTEMLERPAGVVRPHHQLGTGRQRVQGRVTVPVLRCGFSYVVPHQAHGILYLFSPFESWKIPRKDRSTSFAVLAGFPSASLVAQRHFASVNCCKSCS